MIDFCVAAGSSLLSPVMAERLRDQPVLCGASGRLNVWKDTYSNVKSTEPKIVYFVEFRETDMGNFAFRRDFFLSHSMEKGRNPDTTETNWTEGEGEEEVER